MELVQLDIRSYWERVMYEPTRRLIGLYNCLDSSQGLEPQCEEVLNFIHIDPSSPCPYPRGSFGRVVWRRERYKYGIPLWSDKDSIETLEKDEEAPPERTLMYSLKFGYDIKEE